MQAAAIANPGLNTAPTIPVIATRYGTQGRWLSFYVEANDPKAPPQTLAFTLEPGFPTGAVIGLTSGQFSWTPTALQTPGTNTVTVRATDNGSPVKFATRSFTAVAMLDPRIASVQYTPGTGVTISWATVPGLRYRVDYSATLSPIVWLPLTAEFTVPGTTTSIDDTPPAGNERYYRVILLN